MGRLGRWVTLNHQTLEGTPSIKWKMRLPLGEYHRFVPPLYVLYMGYTGQIWANGGKLLGYSPSTNIFHAAIGIVYATIFLQGVTGGMFA